MKQEVAREADPEAGREIVRRQGWRLFPIPIRLPDVEVEIKADRRLAFQVLTAFGASQGSEGASRVLSKDGNQLLVEFKVPMGGPFGGRKIHCTVECVALREPELIEFEGVKGPLPLLKDRFVLEERGACTRFRYESTFGVRGWIPGWIVGMLYVRPMMKRFMRQHVEELKETIEARASRSKLYPQQPCDDEGASEDDKR